MGEREEMGRAGQGYEDGEGRQEIENAMIVKRKKKKVRQEMESDGQYDKVGKT